MWRACNQNRPPHTRTRRLAAPARLLDLPPRVSAEFSIMTPIRITNDHRWTWTSIRLIRSPQVIRTGAEAEAEATPKKKKRE